MTKRTTIMIFADGTEKDVTDKFTAMNSVLFSRICVATKQAGRPVPTSWKHGETAMDQDDLDFNADLDAEAKRDEEISAGYKKISKIVHQ